MAPRNRLRTLTAGMVMGMSSGVESVDTRPNADRKERSHAAQQTRNRHGCASAGQHACALIDLMCAGSARPHAAQRVDVRLQQGGESHAVLTDDGKRGKGLGIEVTDTFGFALDVDPVRAQGELARRMPELARLFRPLSLAAASGCRIGISALRGHGMSSSIGLRDLSQRLHLLAVVRAARTHQKMCSQ